MPCLFHFVGIDICLNVRIYQIHAFMQLPILGNNFLERPIPSCSETIIQLEHDGEYEIKPAKKGKIVYQDAESKDCHMSWVSLIVLMLKMINPAEKSRRSVSVQSVYHTLNIPIISILTVDPQ